MTGCLAECVCLCVCVSVCVLRVIWWSERVCLSANNWQISAARWHEERGGVGNDGMM